MPNAAESGRFVLSGSHFTRYHILGRETARLCGLLPLEKTASRSFRYLSLSLQNGVLRNQGDTGVRPLPTTVSDPITARMVQPMTRLRRPLVQSQRQRVVVRAHSTKCRGSEPLTSLFKFQLQWTTGLTGPGVLIVIITPV